MRSPTFGTILGIKEEPEAFVFTLTFKMNGTPKSSYVSRLFCQIACGVDNGHLWYGCHNARYCPVRGKPLEVSDVSLRRCGKDKITCKIAKETIITFLETRCMSSIRQGFYNFLANNVRFCYEIFGCEGKNVLCPLTKIASKTGLPFISAHINLQHYIDAKKLFPINDNVMVLPYNLGNLPSGCFRKGAMPFSIAKELMEINHAD